MKCLIGKVLSIQKISNRKEELLKDEEKIEEIDKQLQVFSDTTAVGHSFCQYIFDTYW